MKSPFFSMGLLAMALPTAVIDARAAVLRGAPLAPAAGVAAPVAAPPGGARPAQVSAPAPRWTAETPDAMLDLARQRALAPKAKEASIVAAMAVIDELAERAAYGTAKKAFGEIATAPGISPELRGEAAIAAQALSPDEGTDAAATAAAKLGVVSHLAILGPFRDTGGGLAAKDGPEAPGASFADTRARYSWGTIDVGWREIPAPYAGAEGVPLDLFIQPRKESCTFVASRITLDAAKPVIVRVASTGQVRVAMDGVDLTKSDDVHASILFDRVAARVDAPAGDHLLAAKVCTGALPDDGRIRVRLTDAEGAPLAFASSADLRDTGKSPVRARPAPLHVQRIETALSRTLGDPASRDVSPRPGGPAARDASGQGEAPAPRDVPRVADVDAALASAIVRTLGGADDLRSPRAPGLLDAVTRTPGLDPDRLAMAGWIAPSGANRSGWLNLARSRAEAASDAATRAFTERRLVAEHLTARMPDWAIATMRGAQIRGNDAEAVLLQAMVDVAFGNDALRLKALRALAAAADAAPDAIPTSVVDELAALAQGPDTKRALAAHERLARRGRQSPEWVRLLGARGAPAVVAAARACFAGRLDDADDGLAIARTVSQTGDHTAAKLLYAQLAAFAPNRADVWAGLADELAANAGSSDSVMALRRARELAPGEARYRAELELRLRQGDKDGRRGRTGESEGREDERYLVPPKVLLARRQGAPPAGTAPDAADRELHWMRAVVTHPDKRVSQLIQYAREIVVAPRTQDELFEDIPTEGDLTEILRARVHRKDGGTAFPVEEHNEGTRPRIRWPELAPGDVVEVAIRTWTSGAVGGRGDPPFYFLDYAGAPSTHPLFYNEVIVETSKEHPIYLDVIHGEGAGAPRREERDENGRHVTRLVWEKPVVVAEEPLSPNLSEIVPVIVGSNFKSWGDFRAWYTEAIRGFTEPDAEVRRLAGELTKGKASREAKLRAIFDFVSDDIRYVNYVSGEWWLPNRPQQLLARREGDCDDKALLLITLLKSVGIDAQEVMVQTRETGQPSVVLAKNAAVPMFDHGIAFLPGPNGGTYLDATSPMSRLGPIPSMDARAVAFKMDSGPAEIVQLPASSPADHGSDVTWTITLHPDGSGDLVGEERHVGDGAFWLRSYLTQADARTQYVEDNLVGGWFPTVQVDKKIDFDGDLPSGQAWVKYKAHSDGLARHEAKDLVVPLSPSSTLASQLAPLVKRTLPVSLPSFLAPSHQRRTIRVVAPPGFAWGDLPPGGDESDGDFGSAHLDVAKDPKDPRAVVIHRSVAFDRSVVPVDKYPAWRAFIQRVDALMHKGVRLVPSGTASDAVAEKKGGEK